MYGMSVVGALALLRARRVSGPAIAVASVLYVCVAAALTAFFRSG